MGFVLGLVAICSVKVIVFVVILDFFVQLLGVILPTDFMIVWLKVGKLFAAGRLTLFRHFIVCAFLFGNFVNFIVMACELVAEL